MSSPRRGRGCIAAGGLGGGGFQSPRSFHQEESGPPAPPLTPFSSEPSRPRSGTSHPPAFCPQPRPLGGRSVGGFAFQPALPATASQSGGCRASPGTQTRAPRMSSSMRTVGGLLGGSGGTPPTRDLGVWSERVGVCGSEWQLPMHSPDEQHGTEDERLSEVTHGLGSPQPEVRMCLGLAGGGDHALRPPRNGPRIRRRLFSLCEFVSIRSFIKAYPLIIS